MRAELALVGLVLVVAGPARAVPMVASVERGIGASFYAKPTGLPEPHDSDGGEFDEFGEWTDSVGLDFKDERTAITITATHESNIAWSRADPILTSRGSMSASADALIVDPGFPSTIQVNAGSGTTITFTVYEPLVATITGQLSANIGSGALDPQSFSKAHLELGHDVNGDEIGGWFKLVSEEFYDKVADGIAVSRTVDAAFILQPGEYGLVARGSFRAIALEGEVTNPSMSVTFVFDTELVPEPTSNTLQAMALLVLVGLTRRTPIVSFSSCDAGASVKWRQLPDQGGGPRAAPGSCW